MITLNNIRLSFDAPVLENLSLDVQKGQRIGVMGRNGSGKSTLLKLIAGEVRPDAGDISVSPGLRTAYLPQDVPGTLEGTTWEIVAAGAGPTGELLAAYHRQLAAGAASEVLHRLQEEITAGDGWKLETAINRALADVQVDPDLSFAALSGGMKRRVFLARALAGGPDLLLLDEPTNHLDLESIAWLEDFLVSSRLTVMFVTHDRRLLRKLATRIVEIDRGGILDWSCDYPTFLERRQAALDNEEKAWAEFDKKLAQEEVWIRQGVKARRTRSEGRVKALLKMREERRQRRARTGQVSMTINAADRSGDRVLSAKNISFAYDRKPILKDFSFTLMRGDRVGIIGPNGCGKTTLLNLLLGKLPPQQGTAELGANVRPLYFDQLREGVDPEKTVWENLAPEGTDTVWINGKPRHVVSYLQDFLFTSARARTPVKRLSGGERHRLLLAKLFTAPSNLLIFDEPTNDLDTETLELLEEVLLEYEGTLIVVSHDREFLNNVVTSALLFGKDGAVSEYIGGYDDWERQLAQSAVPPAPKPKPERKETIAAPSPDKPRKLSFKEKKELDDLPGRIEALETEQRDLHRRLADFTECQKPGFVTQSKARLEEIEDGLAKSFSRWEELEARRNIES